MKVAIGCDEAAFDLKLVLAEHMAAKGIEVEDYGCPDKSPVLYPDIAATVARAIRDGKHERGVLLCGTGIGMAISANKIDGLRAAQAHDTYSAERARKSNDAQIVTIGARIVGPELAKSIIDAWLASEFQGGGSQAKVDAIAALERP